MKSIQPLDLTKWQGWRLAFCLLSLLCLAAGPLGAVARDLPSRAEVQEELQMSLAEFSTYTGSKIFSIDYPKSWEKIEPKEGLIVCKFRTLSGLISFRVAVEEIPAGMTLDTYDSATIANVKKYMAAEKMPITILSQDAAEIAGTPARRAVFTNEVPDTPLTSKVLQLIAVKNGKAYCFNYTAASASLYDDFMPVISKVIKSFAWGS